MWYVVLIILLVLIVLVIAYLIWRGKIVPPREGVVLFLRPNWDLATAYGHHWLSKLISYATERGWEVIDLEGENVTLEGFLATIASSSPILIHGMGHGNEMIYSGQNGVPLLTACVNDDLMSERFVYLLSCLTGQELGPSMIKKGCGGYLGYTQEFTWTVDEEYTVEEDPYAKPFEECSNAVAMALLDGRSVAEAHSIGIQTFNSQIDHWSTVDDPVAAAVMQWLAWDRDYFIVLGAGAPAAALVSPMPFIEGPFSLGIALTIFSLLGS